MGYCYHIHSCLKGPWIFDHIDPEALDLDIAHRFMFKKVLKIFCQIIVYFLWKKKKRFLGKPIQNLTPHPQISHYCFAPMFYPLIFCDIVNDLIQQHIGPWLWYCHWPIVVPWQKDWPLFTLYSSVNQQVSWICLSLFVILKCQ